LALVEDSVEYGNVAISDRVKIYKLMQNLNALTQKPVFTVIDLQFYYPYTIDPEIDELLQQELAKNDKLIIPIVKDGNGDPIKPLFNVPYGSSDYTTFRTGFNKFSIIRDSSLKSIPVIMHERINGVNYKKRPLYTTCNGAVCFSVFWPTFFHNNDDVRKNANPNAAQFYNIGEVLLDMEAHPGGYTNVFRDKILIIGNFEEDMHTTPAGRMSGPVILSNIYLSLLNRQHFVPVSFVLLLIAAFSGLSYIALYGKMPAPKFNFKFIFSSFLDKYAKKYITYFGCMFLLAIIFMVLYDMAVGLFLPPLIYSGIEYIRNKKYKEI
jgi:hypothetical protein